MVSTVTGLKALEAPRRIRDNGAVSYSRYGVTSGLYGDREMHAEQETRMARVGESEAVEGLDLAGEAAMDRVAVLCGMTYGDVIRAYIVLNGEKVLIELLRDDAPDEIKSVGPDEPVRAKVHGVDLIDQMHYAVVHGDELRAKHKISNRDGDRRKGWQTCYGPAQRRGSTKTKDWRTWTAGRKR